MNSPSRQLYCSLLLSFLLLGSASATKFQQWFWWYVRDGTFPHVAQDVCKDEYDGYMNSINSPDSQFEGSVPGQWCVCIHGVLSLAETRLMKCSTSWKIAYLVIYGLPT